VESAYPIVLVAYEIVCDRGNAPETLALTKAFLGYTASEEGQRTLQEIHYAPISDDVIKQVRERVEALS
jgi:phosphate transport system substrate-binding protein